MVPGPGTMGVQYIPALASSRVPPCVSLLRTPVFPPHQPPLGIPTNFQMLFLHSRSQKSILERAFPEVAPPLFPPSAPLMVPALVTLLSPHLCL